MNTKINGYGQITQNLKSSKNTTFGNLKPKTGALLMGSPVVQELAAYENALQRILAEKNPNMKGVKVIKEIINELRLKAMPKIDNQDIENVMANFDSLA